MRAREVLGGLLTLLAITLMSYELFYVNLTKGYVGVRGEVSVDVILLVSGWFLILIGPWLWFGEVPIAIKKFIEVRTGKKFEKEVGR